ncbi:abscisic acid 8'-hydroxylase 4 [Selaginella moellendorffii]|nr:abscisic acid 8'-hydroxylase 4 [Selaginella moellendorffii]|eukprot:XP_002980421.2 abscisic acid 8'-hydroxylase 4 [Selaginella moellendorffii]
MVAIVASVFALVAMVAGMWDALSQWGILISLARAWRREKNAKLPRGNWWLPWLGESLDFFWRSPDDFYKTRFSRYGSIFLSHIFGSTTIVTSTPEEAKFILGTRHKLFRAKYPTSIDRVLNHPFWEGDFHCRVRKIVQAPMMPEVLKSQISKFDSLATWTLNTWSHGDHVITHAETRKFSFHVALYLVCSLEPSAESMKMLDDYECVAKGAICFPLNVPGTGFHLALKKSKVILEALDNIIARRRMERSVHNDILSSLLNSSDENGIKLTTDQVKNVLITLLFAGHETTGVLLVWIVKYLTENPQVLHLVKEEQEIVRQSMADDKQPLTWANVRNMPYTLKVVQETLRLANVAPFSPREILEDVEYNGILFPKGWRVQVYYRHFHLNPEYYKEPLKFDPSRFEVPPKPMVYTPFGNGIRLCPGSELVKLEVLIFIHRLVTNYSWHAVGADKGIQYWPTPRPKGGYKIKVHSHAHSSFSQEQL